MNQREPSVAPTTGPASVMAMGLPSALYWTRGMSRTLWMAARRGLTRAVTVRACVGSGSAGLWVISVRSGPGAVKAELVKPGVAVAK